MEELQLVMSKIDKIDDRTRVIEINQAANHATTQASLDGVNDHLAKLNSKVAANVKDITALKDDNNVAVQFIGQYKEGETVNKAQKNKLQQITWERIMWFATAGLLALVTYFLAK